jgi:hypothetical protein
MQAHLRIVPWDGYLKYYNLGEKHPQLIEKRRKVRRARRARAGLHMEAGGFKIGEACLNSQRSCNLLFAYLWNKSYQSRRWTAAVSMVTCAVLFFS